MCNFTLPFQGSAEELVERARQGIEEAGGHFEGNTSNGSFEITSPVTIKGQYEIKGQEISITITKKPFFVSCNRIESEMKKLIGASPLAMASTQFKSSVVSHHDDILAHINSHHHLSARATSVKGCITLLDVIEVCYSLSSDEVKVTATLKTPLGNVNLGSVTLNARNPTATLGGHIDGFKAEVTVSIDFQTLELKICGKACAPIVGCKSGCTSVHL